MRRPFALSLSSAVPSPPSSWSCWPGVARRQLTFSETRKAGFLLFAKRRAKRAGFAHFAQRSYANTKSKQKKRRPWLLRPSASLRAACGARSRRGLAKLAPFHCAQTTRSLIRLALRSSAHPQGDPEYRTAKYKYPTAERQKPEYRNPQGHAMACPCIGVRYLYLVFRTSPSWLGRAAQTEEG